MFNITCSGASLSKNKDLFAVGDFTGSVKIFSDHSHTNLLKETMIADQVRYLHFHDYHNDVLLIATFSGNVYVWNTKTSNEPETLAHLNKTVTSIRTSHGSHRVNSMRS
jgi:WD40 repeat protein